MLRLCLNRHGCRLDLRGPEATGGLPPAMLHCHSRIVGRRPCAGQDALYRGVDASACAVAEPPAA